MDILQVKNLSKSFGKNPIIKNITFDIKEGEIVGFVGPNGAGKTTTLKLISSLIYPDSGKIVINGHDLLKEREAALSNVSAIIENPGLYTYLSGKENMEFIRKVRGKSNKEMDFIINYIGLSNRINDSVKKYSLGMKQRLALGMCILSEPKLLILDEPTNGLDPTGNIEFRNLITSLVKEKKISVFLSSHILSEVDKICDRVLFIKEGELILTNSNQKNRDEQSYIIKVNDANKARFILEEFEFICNISVENQNEILVRIKENKLSDILNFLSQNGINFSDIEKVKSNLESEYLNMFTEQGV